MPEVEPQHLSTVSLRARILRLTRMMLHFILGQGSVQAISLITGFFMLRWLPVLQYAEYSTAFAFQCFLAAIVDLGFSGCIVALVGERGHDPEVIGGYIRCSRAMRLRMFGVFGVASAIVFPLVTAHQDWGWSIKCLLWGSVVFSVLVQGQILYGAPLLIHRKIASYYGSSLVQSLTRFLLVSICHFAGVLSSWTAAWIGSLGLVVQGLMYKRSAKGLIIEPQSPDPKLLVEMRRYLAPMWPGMLYYAFQGQLTIGLITYFGKTHNIAEVAALNRLSQLFMLLSATNGVLIEPYVAKISANKLPRTYPTVFLACACTCALILLFAILVPGPFMWIIGPKYAHLNHVMPMAIANTCLCYLGAVASTMNRARKWVWWSSTLTSTSAIVLADFLQIWLTDLTTTASMFRYSIVTASVGLTVSVCVGIYGCTKESGSKKVVKRMSA